MGKKTAKVEPRPTPFASLIGQAVVARDRVYGESRIGGRPGVVLSIGGTIQVATNDLNRVFILDHPLEDFAWAWYWTPTRHAWGVATNLRAMIGPMKSTDVVVDALKRFIIESEDEMPAVKASTMPALPAVFVDHERHTCIVFEVMKGVTYFIPLVPGPFEVLEDNEEDFSREYKPLEDYPTKRAAELYVSYSQYLGASEDALNRLGTLVNITQQELDMAKAKKEAVKKDAGPTAATKVIKAKAGKVTAMVAEKPAKQKAAKDGTMLAGEGRRPSAASLFKQLIMEHKLTDDQIFATVKKEFGLDDSKRSYVSWYRNKLRKEGEQVPDAIKD